MTRHCTPTPKLYAHRGSTLLAPENTTAAFDLALQFQADVLEVDVRLSRDGQVIVTHDERVERTTDGNGPVRAHTLSTLKKLDAGYRFFNLQGETFRGRGVQLLTLSELFERYPQSGINIDIKDNDTAVADAVATVIERAAHTQWVNVGSFHAQIMRHFRRISPAVSTAATRSEVARLYFGGLPRRASTTAAPRASGDSEKTALNRTALPYQCLQIPTAYFGIPLAHKPFIRQVQAKRLGIIYWTINDAHRMRELLQLGIDGIVTDRPDIALDVFRTMGWKDD